MASDILPANRFYLNNKNLKKKIDFMHFWAIATPKTLFIRKSLNYKNFWTKWLTMIVIRHFRGHNLFWELSLKVERHFLSIMDLIWQFYAPEIRKINVEKEEKIASLLPSSRMPHSRSSSQTYMKFGIYVLLYGKNEYWKFQLSSVSRSKIMNLQKLDKNQK